MAGHRHAKSVVQAKTQGKGMSLREAPEPSRENPNEVSPALPHYELALSWLCNRFIQGYTAAPYRS